MSWRLLVFFVTILGWIPYNETCFDSLISPVTSFLAMIYPASTCSFGKKTRMVRQKPLLSCQKFTSKPVFTKQLGCVEFPHQLISGFGANAEVESHIDAIAALLWSGRERFDVKEEGSLLPLRCVGVSWFYCEITILISTLNKIENSDQKLSVYYFMIFLFFLFAIGLAILFTRSTLSIKSSLLSSSFLTWW